MLRAALRLEKRLLSRSHAPITKVRERLARLAPFVPGGRNYTRMAPVDAAGVTGMQAAVAQSRGDRCVLYFHGGGYVVGTAALYRDFLWRVAAAARAQVLYFDYRLAPEHPFPAALDDAVTVYRWLSARFDPRHVAFVGDSAGGGLLLATLLRLRDERLAFPCAAVAMSPWTDLALTGPSMQTNAADDPMLDANKLPELVRHYSAGTDPRNPLISPLYGDVTGFPPALIQAGSDEILCDDAVRMAEKLRAAGCEVELEVWERMPHVWQLYARLLPEARHALARVGTFLQERM
jgi:acetyl esterase/lipase